MEYPLRSKLITSLYSVFICSAVFTEPTLRPSFPSFSIYRFLPDCNLPTKGKKKDFPVVRILLYVSIKYAIKQIDRLYLLFKSHFCINFG